MGIKKFLSKITGSDYSDEEIKEVNKKLMGKHTHTMRLRAQKEGWGGEANSQALNTALRIVKNKRWQSTSDGKMLSK